MSIQALYSVQKTAQSIARDLRGQTSVAQPKCVIFFTSTVVDPSALSAALQESFHGTTVFGCTTAGEIVSGKMLTESVVAMVLGDDIIDDIALEIVNDIGTSPKIPEAFNNFRNHFGKSVADLSFDKHVGIILVDGLSMAEEKIMDTIGNLCDMTFIGGSAGDDLQFKKTHVCANGVATSNAAVFAILKLRNGFDIIKTESFCTAHRKLRATRVDEKKRSVTMFDGIPATEAYAAALGCSEEEAEGKFMSNPVGLMVGEEPYIRSPQRFDGKEMVFYCNIKEGMELDVMNSTDIIRDTTRAVQAKARELGTIHGIIDFHCILRTLELRNKGLCDEYGAIFKDIPTIGFSTYGEEYIGHINQTSTMLVFK